MLILIVVVVIVVFTAPHVVTENLTSFDITKVFTPFGVILFAYLGLVAVPEASEILGNDRKNMKKALLLGIFIPVIMDIKAQVMRHTVHKIFFMQRVFR